MAVACPVCGRQYDVTLFEFDREIECSCGTRVTLAHRLERGGAARGPRFAADAMLGRLARWLRAMGHDTAYQAGIEDEALARLALDEDRVILTRDRALPPRFKQVECLLVESEAVADQLRQVAAAYGLDWSASLLTRCMRCNALLRPVRAEEIADRVPPRVLREQERFRCCERCGRVYWWGSHAKRMRRTLERTLGAPGATSPPRTADPRGRSRS